MRVYKLHVTRICSMQSVHVSVHQLPRNSSHVAMIVKTWEEEREINYFNFIVLHRYKKFMRIISTAKHFKNVVNHPPEFNEFWAINSRKSFQKATTLIPPEDKCLKRLMHYHYLPNSWSQNTADSFAVIARINIWWRPRINSQQFDRGRDCVCRYPN